MSVIVTAEYRTFFKEIKERIHKAQYDALKSVNKELINLYWDIGKSIVAKQEKLGWGKSIVETLAGDLQKEFPGIHGFSSANLWRMRNFYIAYQENEKLAPLVREISWTKNVIIIERCKDNIQREFYIKTTKKFGWTKDVLINQLEAGAFERYMANQTNFDKTVPEKYRHQAKLAVKDEYSFDFLELGDEHSSLNMPARCSFIFPLNKTQVLAYYEIGREIVEFEQKGKTRAEYGEELIVKLSKDMTLRFGKGFSERNLRNMRAFYLNFPIRQTVSAKSLKSETLSRKSEIRQTPY